MTEKFTFVIVSSFPLILLQYYFQTLLVSLKTIKNATVRWHNLPGETGQGVLTREAGTSDVSFHLIDFNARQGGGRPPEFQKWHEF